MTTHCNFILFTIQITIPLQWLIQGFPWGGGFLTPKVGVLIFSFFCWKLHENEGILTWERAWNPLCIHQCTGFYFDAIALDSFFISFNNNILCFHWIQGKKMLSLKFLKPATYMSQLLRVDPSALASSPPAIGWRPASRGRPGATRDGCDLYTFI